MHYSSIVIMMLCVDAMFHPLVRMVQFRLQCNHAMIDIGANLVNRSCPHCRIGAVFFYLTTLDCSIPYWGSTSATIGHYEK